MAAPGRCSGYLAHMTSRAFVGLLVAGAALSLPAYALAAGLPGDPCTTPGEVKPMGSGAIECVNGAWAPSTKQPGMAPAGTAATSTTSSSGGKQAKIFTTIGTALTPETFASSGKQVADASAVRLSDGRIRLISWVNPVGLRTATSTSPAGTAFTADPSTPLPSMAGQPRAMRIDANTIRLFYVSNGTISTAVSKDEGLTYTEQGPVITTEQAGFEPGTLGIVRQGNVYRGYFSNLEKPGQRSERIMRTATSTDLLHWTMGPKLSIAGSHPFPLIDKKGRIALYYAADGSSGYGIYVSTSKNAVSFSGTKLVLAGAGDPDIVSVGRDKWLLYYGTEVSPALGFGIKVAKSIGNPIP